MRADVSKEPSFCPNLDNINPAQIAETLPPFKMPLLVNDVPFYRNFPVTLQKASFVFFWFALRQMFVFSRAAIMSRSGVLFC